MFVIKIKKSNRTWLPDPIYLAGVDQTTFRAEKYLQTAEKEKNKNNMESYIQKHSHLFPFLIRLMASSAWMWRLRFYADPYGSRPNVGVLLTDVQLHQD